jgi:hypothetical protein
LFDATDGDIETGAVAAKGDPEEARVPPRSEVGTMTFICIPNTFRRQQQGMISSRVSRAAGTLKRGSLVDER